MSPRLRPHLTYANVVSTVCLFVVLGGSAVAATAITGKNIKNSSLTGKDVKDSSLTGGDVKDKSLSLADFIGSVQGPKGETGRPGTKGEPGTNGTNASTNVVVRSNFANSNKVQVSCEPGEVATGGGAYGSTGVVGSYPEGTASGPATSWTAYAASPADEGVYVYVMCASP